MFLTNKEEAMLNGEYGEGSEIAMSVLAKLGDMYGADKMISVEGVHIDGAAYGWIFDAGLELVERLCKSETIFRVPTTLNPSSIDFDMWKELATPTFVVAKQLRLAHAFIKMGAIPTWTCTPYQCGANLRYGQYIAWGESNAVGFANTVVGARTEKLGDLVDVCAAILGKYPRFGLYLNENRRGRILFKLDGLDVRHFTSVDYGVLGFFIGTVAAARVPVVTGIPKNVALDQLKAFCTAAAVGGSVSLSHLCGVTPEAPTIKEACMREKPEEKISIGTNEFDETKDKLNTLREARPEVVCIGCPHCSVGELMKIAHVMKGKKVEKGIRFLVITSRMAKALARDMGIIDTIEGAGGSVVTDTCWKFIPLNERILMTDSVKMAWTSLSKFTDVMLDNTEKCLEAAVGEKLEEGHA